MAVWVHSYNRKCWQKNFELSSRIMKSKQADDFFMFNSFESKQRTKSDLFIFKRHVGNIFSQNSMNI